MDIRAVFESFQTQEQALEYLENTRWHGHPICPYCGSESVCRHASPDRASQRWQCQDCSRAFAATVGTIFHGTHIALRDWFLMLALMLNAKKSASACQIARDLGIRRATVWSMMHRARVAMANDPAQSDLLHGIVEADETYVGGKPRKANRKEDRTWFNKRGRGTKKTPVLGVVERGGRVIAMPAKPRQLSSKGISKFINRFVEKAGTLVITDEYNGYNRVSESMLHTRINHSIEYANGLIHTNTIEGFWSLVKRAWYGQHHYYSTKYMNLYIAEACYKYNYRRESDTFGRTLSMIASAA
jgi:transposase-like protein